MCQFCTKHGEGKKWYLNAGNYAEDLMSDLKRQQMVKEFLINGQDYSYVLRRFDLLNKMPLFVRETVSFWIQWKMKRYPYGQVVPYEEIEKIFEFVTSVVRLPCLCRHNTVGTEQRYCYTLSLAPNGGKLRELIEEIDVSYLTGPDTSGLENLTPEQALASIKSHEQEGLCHTIWTFETPFIGAICNCDRTDCYAMILTLMKRQPIMFRSEFIAQVDHDLCNGCRACMEFCQFGALSYSAAREKVMIDSAKCYGCGICRTACANNAIRLVERESISEVASIW